MLTKDTIDWKRLRVPILIAIGSWISSQTLLFGLDSTLWTQGIFCCGYAFLLSAGTSRFGFVFVYRVMVPLTFGIFFLFIYKFSYHNPWDYEGLKKFFEVSSGNNFKYLNLLFDMMSVLYAICTAFLLWKGLTDHDKLRETLSDEANCIERFIGYLHYFDLEKADNQNFSVAILKNFKRYIENIIDGDEIKTNPENAILLRKTTLEISKFKTEDDNDKTALAEIMRALSDLASARSKRISQLEVKMSPYLMIALGVMSTAILFPFFSEPPAGDWIREICIVVMGSLLSFLIVTLLDISKPFNGFWHIKTDAFRSIRRLIKMEISELDRKMYDVE